MISNLLFPHSIQLSVQHNLRDWHSEFLEAYWIEIWDRHFCWTNSLSNSFRINVRGSNSRTCFCYCFASRRNFFRKLSRNLALHETFLFIKPKNPILYKSICSRVGCPVWNIFDTLSNTEPHLKTRYCQVTYSNIGTYKCM